MAILTESYTPATADQYTSLQKTWKSQGFLAESTHTISLIKLKLARISTDNNDTYNVRLCTNDGGLPGAVLATFGSFTLQQLSTSFTEHEFSDTTYNITSGTTYIISITTDVETTNSRYYWWTSTNSGYNDGRRGEGNYISGWTLRNISNDAWFEIYKPDEGNRPSAPINPIPADNVTDITLDDTLLTWEDGGGAETYDVYFRPYGEFFEKIASDITDTFVDAIVAHTPAFNGHYTHRELYLWCVIAKNEYGSNYNPPVDFGIGYGGTIWEFNAMVFDPPLSTGITLDYSGNPDDEDYGEQTGTPTGENNMITIRGLVAAANDKIWYEQV